MGSVSCIWERIKTLPIFSHITVEITSALPALFEHLVFIPPRLLGHDHSSSDTPGYSVLNQSVLMSVSQRICVLTLGALARQTDFSYKNEYKRKHCGLGPGVV